MKAVIQIISEDRPGVLNRVTALLRRKRFNIIGITAGPVLRPNTSRFAITLDDTEERIATIMKQIYKLVEVISVKNMVAEGAIMREMLLAEFEKMYEMPEDMKEFKAEIIGEDEGRTLVEVVGSPEEIDKFINKFRDKGMNRIARSGITSLKSLKT